MDHNQQQNRDPVVMPIENLLLDGKNPRLPSRLSDGSEDDILRWMLQISSVTDLIRSIGEQGYFDGEPLLCSSN